VSAVSYNEFALDQGRDERFTRMLAISACLHVVLLAIGLVLYPVVSSRPRRLPPIYTVSLVSLPAPAGPTARSPKKTASKPFVPPKEQARRIAAKEPPPKAVSLKKTPKTPPAPKPADNQAVINRALARVKGQVKEKTEVASRIDTAIDRLASRDDISGQASVGIKGTGQPGEVEAAMGEYLVIIQNIVNAHWVLPPADLIQKTGPLRGVYIVRIAPSGEVLKSWFETRSGDRAFDQSAEKAVQKALARAGRFPALPKEVKEPYYEVGLVFTPTGIDRK